MVNSAVEISQISLHSLPMDVGKRSPELRNLVAAKVMSCLVKVAYRREPTVILYWWGTKRVLQKFVIAELSVSYLEPNDLLLLKHDWASEDAEIEEFLHKSQWIIALRRRLKELCPITDLESDVWNGFDDYILKLLAKAELADVWSCGVALYVMLVGAFPFEDSDDPKSFTKAMDRVISAQYKIPDHVHISQDCQHLLSRIFIANPAERITIQEIMKHPWFLKNLPQELTAAAQRVYYEKDSTTPTYSLQTEEEIMRIVKEARKPFLTEQEEEGYDDEEEGGRE